MSDNNNEAPYDLIHMLLIFPERKFLTYWYSHDWDSALDGCFYVTSDGGSMWWIIDNRLRAANSAFMTDNKCALPNPANWSVPFWNGKRKRKGVHRQKIVILCQHFIMHHHHAKSLLWTCSKIKLDIFHTFMILDWLATSLGVTELSFTHAQKIHQECVCLGVLVMHRFAREHNKWDNGK